MKLDVEGLECNVLGGMRELLHQRAVAAIKSEVTRGALIRAGCSEMQLLKTLARDSFHVNVDLGCEDCNGMPVAKCTGGNPLSRHKARMYTKGQYDVQGWLAQRGAVPTDETQRVGWIDLELPPGVDLLRLWQGLYGEAGRVG